MLITHVYWTLKGGHVHARVFVGESETTLAHAGNLVMRDEEFLKLYRGQIQPKFFEEQQQ